MGKNIEIPDFGEVAGEAKELLSKILHSRIFWGLVAAYILIRVLVAWAGRPEVNNYYYGDKEKN